MLLGQVSDEDKVRVYHSVDVFCAPNTGGESFGIVLAEAMAAGAPIVASDLDAFRQVLRGGEAGELFADRQRGRGWPPRPGGCWTTRPGGPRCGGRVRGGPRLRLAGGGPRRGAGLRGGRARAPGAWRSPLRGTAGDRQPSS